MPVWELAKDAFAATTGRIERVDPKTGAVTVLYDRCGTHKRLGPNDIVFDGLGGFACSCKGSRR